jgi:hypothetical protein
MERICEKVLPLRVVVVLYNSPTHLDGRNLHKESHLDLRNLRQGLHRGRLGRRFLC